MVGIRSFPFGARPIFRCELLVWGRAKLNLISSPNHGDPYLKPAYLMVKVGLKKTSSERNTPETSKINKIQINLPFLTGKSQVNHLSLRRRHSAIPTNKMVGTPQQKYRGKSGPQEVWLQKITGLVRGSIKTSWCIFSPPDWNILTCSSTWNIFGKFYKYTFQQCANHLPPP